MKYNIAYSQKLNLKETIKLLNYIELFLVKKFKGDFKLMKVDIPAFDLEDSSLLVKAPQISRNVTFDSIFEDRTFGLNLAPSNFLGALMDKLDLNINEGLITYTNTIERDKTENIVQSITKPEIIIQIVSSEEDSIKKVEEITSNLHKYIYQLACKFEKNHKIKNLIPSDLKKITAQQLQNEFPDYSVEDREDIFNQENDLFILKAPGSKLYSGDVHEYQYPEVYDLENFNSLVMRDRVNFTPIKAATVARLASGKQLDDQLSLYGMIDLKQSKHYSTLVKKKEKIIEIKLSIPLIAMSLLGKGHIAEVQGGVYTEESRTIHNKHKLEVF